MGKEQQMKNQRCETCSTNIESKSAVFHCVACGNYMHLTTKCTGMSTEAFFGISSIINNVLIVCQICVDLKKKDLIIEQLASSRDDEKINKMHTEIEELRAEIKANNLSLKTKLHEIKTKTFEKTTRPAELKLPKEPSYKKPVNKEQYGGIRFRGIPELNSKSTRDRYEHDLKEVKAIMKHLKVFCNVTDIKRLGKFSENKHRTLVVKIDSDYGNRLILLSLRKLKDYGKPVFIGKELNPEEQANENEILQMRRTIINQGTSVKSKNTKSCSPKVDRQKLGRPGLKRK